MNEAFYICPSCGEEIIVPIDSSEGTEQDYIEDCPVCCCPNHLKVSIDGSNIRVDVESE